MCLFNTEVKRWTLLSKLIFSENAELTSQQVQFNIRMGFNLTFSVGMSAGESRDESMEDVGVLWACQFIGIVGWGGTEI